MVGVQAKFHIGYHLQPSLQVKCAHHMNLGMLIIWSTMYQSTLTFWGQEITLPLPLLYRPEGMNIVMYVICASTSRELLLGFKKISKPVPMIKMYIMTRKPLTNIGDKVLFFNVSKPVYIPKKSLPSWNSRQALTCCSVKTHQRPVYRWVNSNQISKYHSLTGEGGTWLTLIANLTKEVACVTQHFKRVKF